MTAAAWPESEPATRTLLVDDHPLVLDGLTRALTRNGMNVVGTASEGDAALDFLAAHEVDLLVVDLRLGDESGLDLIRTARARFPALKMSLLTSFDLPAFASAAVRAGANGILLKASSADEICRRLRDVARGAVVIDPRMAAAILAPPESLSSRETAILALVADGMTNRGIGERLHLSHHTVKEYLAIIMRKLGVGSRAEAASKAIRSGLLSAS